MSKKDHPAHNRLNAYAQKRRRDAGPPLELHPADRRLLQDEVRRLYGTRSPSTPFSWIAWIGWWPRLATAFGLCLALGWVTWALLNPAPSPMQMAQQTEPPPSPEPSSTPATPPQPMVASEMLAEKDKTIAAPQPSDQSAQPQKAADADSAKSARAIKVVSKGEPRPLALAEQPAPASALSLEAAVPASTPAPEPPASASRPSARSEDIHVAVVEVEGPIALPAASTSKTVVTSFAMDAAEQAPARDAVADQRAVAGAARIQSAPVLAFGAAGRTRSLSEAVMRRFEFKATAQEIEVRDADGSVYRGHWLAEAPGPFGLAALRSDASTGSKLRSRPTPAPTPAETDFQDTKAEPASFEVSGTNETLGRRVVFRGSLVRLPSVDHSEAEASKKPAPSEGKTELSSFFSVTNASAWPGDTNLTASLIISGTVNLEEGDSWTIHAFQQQP